MNKKVFVIGLDGATLDLILPWVKEGRLPGFQKIIQQGVHGPLESTPNQRSASAWTSMMTGKNPGKHGIYEFYEYVPGTYDIRFLNCSDRKSESLWGILTRYGKKVVVINVPMTYPAEEVDGAFIAGLDAPGVKSRGFMHPPELYDELSGRFGEYIIEPGITGCIVNGRIDEAIELLHHELEQKLNITKYLMEKRQWDFFKVVFRSLDGVQHCFWKFIDPQHPEYTEEGNRKYGRVIYDVYKKVDLFIEDLLLKLGEDTTLMVVSDHGFGRKHQAMQQLNLWLASKGYLTMRARNDNSSGITAKILAGLYRAVVGRTSRRLKERLVKLFPDIRNKVQSRLIFSGIDWQKTMAYSDTLFPNIMINLRGREPLGIVGREEYKGLIERLKSDLGNLRDSETGEPIVADVFVRDEIYNGQYVDRSPELLIRWREDIPIHGIKIDNYNEEKRESGSHPLIPGEDPRVISGDHHLQGVFFIKGRDVRENHVLKSARIIDIAPTVLYELGCPIPADMDGRLLRDAYINACLESNPPEIEKGSSTRDDKHGGLTGYSEEDSESIAARLRDLGYVE